jgi:hypothetical protein
MNLRRNHENYETWFPPSLCDLCDEVFPDVSVEVGESDVSTGVEVGEFFVVEAELMEDGGPEVRRPWWASRWRGSQGRRWHTGSSESALMMEA